MEKLVVIEIGIRNLCKLFYDCELQKKIIKNKKISLFLLLMLLFLLLYILLKLSLLFSLLI